MKKRIWELDVLRGLCVLGMVIVHFFYDLRVFADTARNIPDWFYYLGRYGHIFFILISGICVTLGRSSVKRGIYVLGAALLVSYATFFAELVLHMGSIRIWFGILHLLGVCMLLYPLFKKLPHWALALSGITFVAIGFWLQGLTVEFDFLFPLGLRSQGFFAGSDYFPLFPNLGWFLLGAALGKSLYRNKESLLPSCNESFCILRFFRFCGVHSLAIYLIHQPVLTGLVLLFA